MRLAWHIPETALRLGKDIAGAQALGCLSGVVLSGVSTPEQVQAVCGLRVVSKDELEAPAPKASGTLESHYAPKAQVRLMTASDLQTSLDLLGDGASDKLLQDGPLVATYSRAILKTANTRVLCRRMPDDAAATAQQLFAVLRAFDAQGVKLIWIEAPPANPEWDGVRDRLQRASAH